LTITHPRNGDRREFVAPLPFDFASYLAARAIDTSANSILKWAHDA
jgi:hypothetical protein